VGFTLTSGGRTLVEAPPAGSLGDRFYQIYGERPDLVRVGKDAAGIRVEGYVAALGEQGPTRGPQHVFVNRRIVRDRTIAHAIQQAYSVATIKERSPEVHLFIEMAPHRLDVNVHPTKAEVRFLEQGLVHEVLRRAIVDALMATGAPEMRLGAPGPGSLWSGEPLPGAVESERAVGLPMGFGGPAVAGGPAPGGAGDPRVTTTAGRLAIPDLIRSMTPIGQFRNTFIVAVDDEGLAIVDQHVAHERVLFEEITERLRARAVESQRLLTPVIFECGPAERQHLLGHGAALARLGFEISDFGGTSVRVLAVPALLGWERAEAVLRAVASDLDGLAPGAGVDEALGAMAATMACHAAVKANDPLTTEKMQYLLDALGRTAHSSVCPHGRPVVLRLTRREIERNFERI
jgi:DNA mismatch repair protein MutL